MRTFLLLLISVWPALAAQYFCTQNGAGSKDGTSLANAWSVSDFNSTNRPTGGDSVSFSGSFSSRIEPTGCNGTSSARLILDFTQATLHNYISLASRHDLTLRGGTFATDCAGSSRSEALIEFNQQQSNHITIDGMRYTGPSGGTLVLSQAWYLADGLFVNNHIDNVRGGVASDSANTHDLVIRNNYFRTSINTATQTDVIFLGDAYNVTIEGNALINRSPGQNNDGTHNDVIQTFHGGSGGAGDPSGWVVRYNWIALAMETPRRTGDNSWMQMEQFSNAKGFGLKIYDNVFVGSGPWAGNNGFGWSGTTTAHGYVYNNTVIRHSGPDRTIGWITGGKLWFRNNVGEADPGQTGTFIDIKAMTPGAPYDHNFFYRWSDATSQQAGPHGSTSLDPKFANYQSDQYWPAPDSPLIGAGDSTIGAEYNKGLAPGCTWPNPQLVTRSGAWDVGAYVATAGQGGPTPTPNPTASPSPTPNPTPAPTPPSVGAGDILELTGQDTALFCSVAGDYSLIGTVTAPDLAANSVWIDFDSDPNGNDTRCWDMNLTPSAQEQTVTWRGNAQSEPPSQETAQFNPKVWTLSRGPHTLYVVPREAALVTRVQFIASSAPSPTPVPTPQPTPTPGAPTYNQWRGQQTKALDDWTKAHPPVVDP